MLKNHISFSEVDCFNNYTDEYYQKYVLGIRTPPNEPMMLGTIIHNTIQNTGFNWKRELSEKGFTSEKQRIVEKIALNTELPVYQEWEKKLEVKIDDWSLLGYLDGFSEKKILEIKTGSSFWSQQRADESLQISVYSYLFRSIYGFIPEVELLTVNTRNGKFRSIETKRTDKQISDAIEIVNDTVYKIKKMGWWDYRV